jgi:glyoxylase-like metal-dependent hydrolase (beta-lactamase superfamily II)
MKKLHKSIYCHTTADGMNVGCVIGEDGVVCIDLPLDPEETRGWRAQIAEFTDKPVRAVMFTTSDRMNSGSLAVVKSPAILHEAAFAQLYATAEPPSDPPGEPQPPAPVREPGAGPEVTFSSAATFVLGTRHPSFVDAVHRGGYSPDASFVIPRDSGVVFVGNHVVVGHPPDLSQGDFDRWQTILTTLRRNRHVATVVPGWGAPGNTTIVDETLDYIKVATARVKALVRANRARSDVAALIPELLMLYTTKSSKGSARQDVLVQHMRAGLERIYDNLKADAAV